MDNTLSSGGMKQSKKEKHNEAGFVTKASAQYCDKFSLRAAIQAIPILGSSLDTMLAGLGAKYQYQRLEHFIYDLRGKFEKLEHTNKLSSIEPSEELFDFMMQVFDQIIKVRSEKKRKLFANILVNQVRNDSHWDEVETASRLLSELNELHIKILDTSLKLPICDGVFENLQVFMLEEYTTDQPKNTPKIPPTNISKIIPAISNSVLKMACSELIAKGLLHDEGIGRYNTRNMKYFIATDMARWFMNWICEPPASTVTNNSQIYGKTKKT
jgi:hypothetical protein